MKFQPAEYPIVRVVQAESSSTDELTDDLRRRRGKAVSNLEPRVVSTAFSFEISVYLMKNIT